MAAAKIYNGVYSYGSFDESWRAAAAALSTGVVLTGFSFVDELVGLPHIPHSVPAIAAAFSLIMMAFVPESLRRNAFRALSTVAARASSTRSSSDRFTGAASEGGF